MTSNIRIYIRLGNIILYLLGIDYFNGSIYIIALIQKLILVKQRIWIKNIITRVFKIEIQKYIDRLKKF